MSPIDPSGNENSDQVSHVGAPPGQLRVLPDSPRPRVTAITYGPDRTAEQEVTDLASLMDLKDAWPVVWVNVDGLGDVDVLRELGRLFGLHALALEDVTSLTQRAKIEEYADELFFIAHMVSISERIETEQLSIFLGQGFVVTFQERVGDCLEPVRKRIREGRGRIRQAGADFLAYAILDAVVDGVFPVLEQLGEQLEELEREALAADSEDVLRKIRRTKRGLLLLRRTVWPQRDAFADLVRDEHPLILADTRLYLRDCRDHVTRLIDTIEGYRELASDLSNVYLTAISNRMNAVMKSLTVIATIFIPLTFVTSLYGMNFQHMPELKWPWAYPAALGVMAAMGIGMLTLLRRKRWL